MPKCLTTIETGYVPGSRVSCKPMAAETRSTSSRGGDIVCSAWQHAAAVRRGTELRQHLNKVSCDMFLGIPFNIASYALLLHLFASWTGYTPGTLTMMLADVHIYTNHLDQVAEQLSRDPLPLPQLYLKPVADAENKTLEVLLQALEPNDISLVDYQHHPAIKAPMAG